MSVMVELVARAIAHRDGIPTDNWPKEGVHPIPDQFRELARSAIAAMRDPTEAMLDAAEKAYSRDETHMSTYHCVGEGYRAAIDEALK